MKEKIDTETKNIEYYSDAIKSSENKSFLEFFRWFNGGENVNAIINSGYRDFYTSILKDKVFQATKENSKYMTALEIGCGGGRILNAACKYFGKVIGVDIHNSFKPLEEFLSQENDNFELHKIADNKIHAEDKSIDFIYSFIVFQHILKISVFKDYLVEIKRILKPEGLAIIYFGRPRKFSKKIFKSKFLNRLTVFIDKVFFENLYLNSFKTGYFENYKAEVNHVNLEVSLKRAKKMFENIGMKIIEKAYSKNEKYYGTQYYFIVKHED